MRSLFVAAPVALILSTMTGPAAWSAPEGAPKTRSVLLISVDGLRPEFYLNARFQAPNLKLWKLRAAYATSAVPEYPSSTFPNHATLATGTTPAHHGIVSNTIFDLKSGPTIDWYWDSKHLKVPALWDLARKNRKTSAVLGWPASAGASADWLVPEVFSPYGIDHEENWKYTLRATRRKLMQELQASGTIKKPTSTDTYDRWMAEAAIHILRKYQPDLTMLHFRALDEIQHAMGPDSELTAKTLTQVDEQIGKVLAAVDPATTLIMILGDHGFAPIEKELNLNSWFREQGWLEEKAGKLSRWTVLAHVNGDQAAIYAKDPANERRIFDAFGRLEKTMGVKLKVFDQQALSRMGAFPDALCAVDAPKGYSFGSHLSGPVVRPLGHASGTHGALAEEGSLRTGLMIIGPGVSPGTNLGIVKLVDIAPSVAKYLGFPLKADGHPLEIITGSSQHP